MRVRGLDRSEGDYESIKTTADARDREFRLAYSAQVPTGPEAFRSYKIRRSVLPEPRSRR